MKTVRFDYVEKLPGGGEKRLFTRDEAMAIVGDCKKTHSANGRFGYGKGLYGIERYYGRFGDGWCVHHGFVRGRRDYGEFHHVDYYTKPITEDSVPPDPYADEKEFILK